MLSYLCQRSRCSAQESRRKLYLSGWEVSVRLASDVVESAPGGRGQVLSIRRPDMVVKSKQLCVHHSHLNIWTKYELYTRKVVMVPGSLNKDRQ